MLRIPKFYDKLPSFSSGTRGTSWNAWTTDEFQSYTTMNIHKALNHNACSAVLDGREDAFIWIPSTRWPSYVPHIIKAKQAVCDFIVAKKLLLAVHGLRLL